MIRPQHPRIARAQDASWERHGPNSYARMIDAYALCSKLIREANEASWDSHRLQALVACWGNADYKKFVTKMIPNPATIEDARKALDALICEFGLPAPQEIPEEGNIVVTKDSRGKIVSVTRQDEEGRILSVIAESTPDREPELPPGKATPWQLAALALFICRWAKESGQVLTIDLSPNLPLRMGDFEMVPRLRVARSVYNAEPIAWFRVVKGSNFDDAMVSEEWASECLSKENAETRCQLLNEKCGPHSRDWHSVRAETYTLYEFQP